MQMSMCMWRLRTLRCLRHRDFGTAHHPGASHEVSSSLCDHAMSSNVSEGIRCLSGRVYALHAAAKRAHSSQVKAARSDSLDQYRRAQQLKTLAAHRPGLAPNRAFTDGLQYGDATSNQSASLERLMDAEKGSQGLCVVFSAAAAVHRAARILTLLRKTPANAIEIEAGANAKFRSRSRSLPMQARAGDCPLRASCRTPNSRSGATSNRFDYRSAGTTLTQRAASNGSQVLARGRRHRFQARACHKTSSAPVSSKGTASSTEADLCWNCRAPRTLLQNESTPVPESAFICARCGRVQPNLPPDVDYFALFGIPDRFLLDESLLERRFREWQRRLHPDKFAGRQHQEPASEGHSAHAQALHAEKASALVNAAHDVLKSPHSRALYMLAERGVTLEPEHDDVSEQREMAPDFLEEMLALREQLDETAQSQEGLRALAAWISEAKARVCRELDEAFEQSSQSTDESMRRCRDLAARLQFYHRLEMAAKERL